MNLIITLNYASCHYSIFMWYSHLLVSHVYQLVLELQYPTIYLAFLLKVIQYLYLSMRCVFISNCNLSCSFLSFVVVSKCYVSNFMNVTNLIWSASGQVLWSLLNLCCTAGLYLYVLCNIRVLVLVSQTIFHKVSKCGLCAVI